VYSFRLIKVTMTFCAKDVILLFKILKLGRTDEFRSTFKAIDRNGELLGLYLKRGIV
jgi:hypothetical protein